MTNGQTPEERGVYETLRYTFSYAPEEEEEEEVIFSRSIHARREIFRVQGNNKGNRPFFLSFPGPSFGWPLLRCGNPAIRNKRGKGEGSSVRLGTRGRK